MINLKIFIWKFKLGLEIVSQLVEFCDIPDMKSASGHAVQEQNQPYLVPNFRLENRQKSRIDNKNLYLIVCSDFLEKLLFGVATSTKFVKRNKKWKEQSQK